MSLIPVWFSDNNRIYLSGVDRSGQPCKISFKITNTGGKKVIVMIFSLFQEFKQTFKTIKINTKSSRRSWD